MYKIVEFAYSCVKFTVKISETHFIVKKHEYKNSGIKLEFGEKRKNSVYLFVLILNSPTFYTIHQVGQMRISTKMKKQNLFIRSK